MIRVSIIICNYHSERYLEKCLASLPSDQETEIIIVNNGTRNAEALSKLVATNDRIRLLESGFNMGFARACNLGAQAALGTYILFLNPDAELMTENGIAQTADFMDSKSDAGLCGALLTDSNGRLMPSARPFPNFRLKWASLRGEKEPSPLDNLSEKPIFSAIKTDWVPGAYAMISREVFNAAGGFDERYFLYFEEVDLCLRLKSKGLVTYCLPRVVVRHVGGGSSKNQSEKTIDTPAGQILRFRLMAECLFWRKQRGVFYMIATMGCETLYRLLKSIAYSLSSDERRKQAQRYSRQFVSECFNALRQTKMGSYSPPPPWV